MSNPIKIVGPGGLIDSEGKEELEGLVKSIRSLRSESKKLEQATASYQGFHNSLKQITDAAAAMKAKIEPLSALFEKEREQILALSKASDLLVASSRKIKDSQAGQAKANDLVKGSVAQIEAETRKLTKEYKLLGPVTDQNKTKFAELVKNINETRAASNSLLAPIKKTRQEMQAAVGSYDALVRENRELLKQLKALPDAYDKTTGAINRNNREAVRLSDQVSQNTQRLKAFDSSMGQAYRNVGNYESILGKATTGMKGFALQAAGAYFGLQALAEGAQRAAVFVFDSNLKISDSQADVRKTTGLTADEVDRLTDSLTRLNTRSSTMELLDIAKIGGQLGIAKEDILDFVKAIDVANVALGDDFSGGAEQIATELGKIEGVFRVSAESGDDLATSLINIGSVFNEVGAQGKATAPFLADVALRVGAVSSNAGIGLDKVVAYAATLEGLGYSAEVSGTALNNLVGNMAANSKKFYEVARFADSTLELQEFVDLINTDANAALQLFLKGLNAGGESTTSFNELLADLKIKGASARAVITSLAKNTDEYARYQEIANVQLKNGTSLAAEFTIKNENLAGSWDKFKKSLFDNALSSRLSSVFKSAIDGATGLLNILRSEPEDKFSQVFENQSAKVDKLEKATVPLLDKYQKLREEAGDNKESQEALNKVFADLRGQLPGTVLEFNKYGEAIGVNTEGAKKYIEQQKEILKFNTASAYREQKKRLDELGVEYDRLQSKIEQAAKKGEGPNRYQVIQTKNLRAGILAALEATEGMGRVVDQNNDRITDSFEGLRQYVEGTTKVVDISVSELAKKVGYVSKSMLDSSKATAAATEAEKAAAAARIELSDEQLAALKRQRDAEYEYEKSRLEIQATIFEEISKDEELSNQERNDNARKAAQTRLKIAVLTTQHLLSDSTLLYKERARIAMEGAEAIRQIERKLQEDLLKTTEIKVLTPEIDMNPLTRATETATETLEKSWKRYNESIAASMKRTTEEHKRNEKEKTEATERALEEQRRLREQAEDAYLDFVDAGASAYFTIQQDRYAADMEAFQVYKQGQLALTAEGSEARVIMEANLAEQEKKIRMKQAKMEKEQAMFSIVLNTAMAVAQVNANPVVNADVTQSLRTVITALVIGTGLAQLAAVAARPLPAFFKGVENFGGGLAVVDEKGPELYENRGKRWLGLDTGPRVAYLPKGTTVHPHDSIETQMAINPEGYLEKLGSVTLDRNAMGNGQIGLDQAERNKVNYQVNVLRQDNLELLRGMHKVEMAIKKMSFPGLLPDGEKLLNTIYRNGKARVDHDKRRWPNNTL